MIPLHIFFQFYEEELSTCTKNQTQGSSEEVEMKAKQKVELRATEEAALKAKEDAELLVSYFRIPYVHGNISE